MKVFGQSQTEDGKPAVENLGFLIADGADSFQILTPGLAELTYEKRRNGSGPRSGRYEQVEFGSYLKEILRMRNMPYAGMDEPDNWAYRSSTSDSVLAWIAWHKGFKTESEEFFKARKDWGGRSVPKMPSVRAMKDEVAARVNAELVARFEDRRLTRENLLADFAVFAERFQGTQAGKDAADVVKLLQTMVTEDKERAARPANLQATESVADLIWLLRDQGSDYQYAERRSGCRARLIEIGMSAVPQLLDALQDRRFTRTVFHQDSGPPTLITTDWIERVGGVAKEILEEIAHRSFDGRDMAVVEKSARDWFTGFKERGESAVLIEGTRKGDENSARLAEQLVKSYPKLAMAPIAEGYSKCKDEYQRAALVTATATLPSALSRTFLQRVIGSEKDSQVKVAAIKALANTDAEAATSAMAREWNKVAPGDHWEIDTDSMLQFLLESSRPSAIKAVMKGLRDKSPSIRQQAISFFDHGYDWNMQFPRDQRPDARAIQQFRLLSEDLIASELDDRDRWGGSMSGGDVSFSSPQLSELATYSLHNAFPAIYPFVKGKTPAEREKQRLTSLNIYRFRRGLKPLNAAPVTGPLPIADSVMQPLIARVVSSPDPEAAKAILAKGLGAMPALIKAQGAASGDAQKRLSDVSRSLSHILRSVEFLGDLTKGETQIAKQVKAMEGKLLTTDDFFLVFKILATGIVEGKFARFTWCSNGTPRAVSTFPCAFTRSTSRAALVSLWRDKESAVRAEETLGLTWTKRMTTLPRGFIAA